MAEQQIPTTDAELLTLVREVSLRDFGLAFRHSCRFNHRLRTVGGRYLLRSHNLEFNPRYAETFGFSDFVGTIRHELCHYHLHIKNCGYRHGDKEFRDLLARVGGARYAKPLHPADNERTIEYGCSACGMIYRRKRRIDVSRYVCGRCRGMLRLLEKQKVCDQTHSFERSHGCALDPASPCES